MAEPTAPACLAYEQPAGANDVRVEPAAGGAYLVVPAESPAARALGIGFGLTLVVALAAYVVGPGLGVPSGGRSAGPAVIVLFPLLIACVIAGCGLLAREVGLHLRHGPRSRRLFLTTAAPAAAERGGAEVLARVRSADAVKVVADGRTYWVLRVRATQTLWGRPNLVRHDLLVGLPADRLLRVAADLRQALGIGQADHF